MVKRCADGVYFKNISNMCELADHKNLSAFIIVRVPCLLEIRSLFDIGVSINESAIIKPSWLNKHVLTCSFWCYRVSSINTTRLLFRMTITG